MTSGIAIKFLSGGAISIATDERVDGFIAVCQSAMINLLTDSQTDVIFPDRGTDLFRTAVGGGIYDLRSANHGCNFAASETLFFSREYEVADTPDKLEAIQLTPTYVGMQRLDASAGFQSVDGRLASFSVPT